MYKRITTALLPCLLALLLLSGPLAVAAIPSGLSIAWVAHAPIVPLKALYGKGVVMEKP